MSATELNILVLEDSHTQAKAIERLLVMEGVRVETISSASDLVKSESLKSLDISAALIDVHFGNVCGLRLIGPLLQRWPGVAVAMMTANGKNDFEVLGEARQLGAHYVMRKPFSRDDVKNFIADVHHIRKTGDRRKHVVVIDDSKTTCQIVSDLLAGYHYRVSTFQKGEDAMQQLSFDHVDAVLTDMQMPGMPGQELITLVRDVWKNVAIVAMSGRQCSPVELKNADAFIPKPFGPDEIIKVLKKAISKHEHGDLPVIEDELDIVQLDC